MNLTRPKTPAGFYAGLILLAASAASAQNILSSLQGTVTDATNAAVPNARITVRDTDTDTGATRTLLASPTGAFRADGLTPGAYTLQAETPTLRTRRPLRLTLTLGSSQELHLRLDPTAVMQAATVTGRAATVEGNTTAPAPNTTEASLNTFLPGLTVTYLPNRDRNFAQFTQLTATAVPDDDGALTLDGQRSGDLLTTLDGISFTSPLFGGQRGAEDLTLFLPLTAVREFEVVRTGTDAATGRSTAGLVNVATKSGANRARGEAFYTGRAPAFTAADAFGHPLTATENAFGASYGLPLSRDRAFAFLSLEKDLLQSPFYASFDPQAPGIAIPTSLAAQQGQIPEHHSPLAAFVRVDLNLNPANVLSLELGLDRIRSTNLGDDGLSRSPATAAFASSLSGQSLTTRAGLTTVITPRLFNNAVAAWSTDHRNLQPNAITPEQFVNGFGILGGSADGPHLYTAGRTQLTDDLTLTRGRDALTFCGSLSVEPSYEQRELNTDARFDYNSLPDLLANNPRRFQQTLLTGNPRYQATVTQLGLYADAHLALSPTVFLTAGFRWDAQFNPQPTSPNLSLPQQIPNDLHQFQPRLGLAWTPNPKTVLRLSVGLYAAPTPATWFHPVFIDSGAQTLTLDSDFDPTLLTLSGALTGTPHALAAAPAGLTNYHAIVYGIAPGFRNPTSAQVAASLDRQLLPKLGLTLGYIHNSTWALPRELDANLAPPTLAEANGTPLFTSPRPIAGVGRLLVIQSTAHASYKAGTVSLNAPISRRSTLLANYSLARTSDDDSSTGPYGPVTALNPFHLAAERAYSNLDVRHDLNLNAIFNLPAGLKLNPILLARSGQPYTPIVGFDTQNDANDRNARALLNGLVAPRNILRQPAFADLDLRFVKDFTLKGEGHHLDLFADLFNLTSFGNRRFAPGAQDIVGTPTQPIFSTGLPLYAPGVTRFGGPRTLQLTARLVGF